MASVGTKRQPPTAPLCPRGVGAGAARRARAGSYHSKPRRSVSPGRRGFVTWEVLHT